MTALENVAVPLELAGNSDAFARAAEELTAVGLGHRLHHYPAQLSGGQQQRVAISRGVAPGRTSIFAAATIGRDACGDRVVPYVENPEGSGSLQQTTTITTP